MNPISGPEGFIILSGQLYLHAQGRIIPNNDRNIAVEIQGKNSY